MKNRVIVVVGPTASGKTALAVSLAHQTNGEVISADSMQIYRGMDIGTAKPDQSEMDGVLHHMIDIADPDEDYSVALFQRQAGACISDILERGKQPIIAGGTGLYVNALTYELDFTQTTHNPALRAKLEEMPPTELYRLLCSLDSSAQARIHPNNKKRVIRAIEILQSGTPQRDYDFDRKNDRYDYRMIGLTCEREALYQRIHFRVDDMIKRGLREEAEKLFRTYGFSPASMQAIGYKEWKPYFEGNAPLEEITAAIKQNTRRFAKRQLTWFRRDDRIRWYDISQYSTPECLAETILDKKAVKLP